jgi:hypothetical protein
MSKRKEKHVIMFSGGASSAYIAKWVTDKYGKENMILFFTDTLWEDEDNMRFMNDISKFIGVDITRKVDGRTPEDVFFQAKYLGNSRFAQCSIDLKVKQTILFLEELSQKDITPILYFGIGPQEEHRADSLREHYKENPIEPIETRFPLLEEENKFINPKYVIQNEWGIKLPRMYDLGFSHANCAGRCVRAGLHHYALLYKVWRDRFMKQEEMEQNFRKTYDLDVSMIKRKGKPYTLKQFREEMLEKMTPEELDKYSKGGKRNDIPCQCLFN